MKPVNTSSPSKHPRREGVAGEERPQGKGRCSLGRAQALLPALRSTWASANPLTKRPGRPQSRDPTPRGHCPTVCPRTVPTQLPARFTAQRGKASRLLPGSRNVMFWLPVKGPVYWKHTSFPMFSFLSLFLLFVFPRVHCPGP